MQNKKKYIVCEIMEEKKTTIQRKKIKAYSHECNRKNCMYQWVSKIEKPKYCPKCHDPFWWEKRE